MSERACTGRGIDVHFVARGSQLAAPGEHGVWVRSRRGDFAARPHATDRPDEIGAVVRRMMEEALEVASGVGARPSVSVERRLAGAERTGEHKTSTLQDLERGRPMELDVLLTAVVGLADVVGAEVSTLRAIAAVADLLNQSVAAA